MVLNKMNQARRNKTRIAFKKDKVTGRHWLMLLKTSQNVMKLKTCLSFKTFQENYQNAHGSEL